MSVKKNIRPVTKKYPKAEVDKFVGFYRVCNIAMWVVVSTIASVAAVFILGLVLHQVCYPNASDPGNRGTLRHNPLFPEERTTDSFTYSALLLRKGSEIFYCSQDRWKSACYSSAIYVVLPIRPTTDTLIPGKLFATVMIGNFIGIVLMLYRVNKRRRTRLCDELSYNTRIRDVAECSRKNTVIPAINFLATYNDNQETQTDTERRTPQPPISTPQWSTASHFSTSGGTLHSEESDVILHVPNKAINSYTYIDIYSAVCANEARIRELVPFQRGAVLASPLAEFFVEEGFQFQRPVWITLPHCLPPNPDLQQVRVYRLFRDVDGSVNVHRLRFSSTTVSQTENADDNFCDEDDVEWETVASFRFQDEKLQVFTTSFSGYVCLYCGQPQLPSVLYLLANVSLKKKRRSGEHSAAVSLHVWDRRLEIKDFQKEYGIPMNADARRQTTIRLIEEQTQLMTRLELSGDSWKQWRFCVRPDSRKPTTDIIQSHVLVDAVSCTNGHCGRPSHPQTSSWRLESCGPCQNGCSFECVIDVCTAGLERTNNASEWPSKSDEKGPCLQIPLEVFVEEPTSAMEEAEFKDVHADSQSVGHVSGALHQTFPKQAVLQSKISNEILGRRGVQEESDTKIEISRSTSPLQNNRSPRNATGGKLDFTHNRFSSSGCLTTKEPTSASYASSNDGLLVPYRRSTQMGEFPGWEDLSPLSS